MELLADARDALPEDAGGALLAGRVLDPGAGPCVVAVRGDAVVDLTATAPTMAHLLEREDAAAVVREAPGTREWPLDEVLAASLPVRPDRVHLLAPLDLQVVKGCGVTFVTSLVERVIEERAGGDASRAAALRAELESDVGGALATVKPGSEQARELKEALQRRGVWSQYLEVGIGPDPEVFTKAPVLASVGLGAEIGVARTSSWNNPEPEVVLAVTSRGRVVGATLGNDVNLRDVEGRSALLLGKAKDNNASSAVGPFVRLFGDGFSLDDVRAMDLRLEVIGPDGFVLDGRSSMAEISRDPLELVQATIGAHHSYPDGFFLFTGTLFAPTEDRHAPGAGFTHELGDVVRISTPRLGTLVNVVTHAEDAPPWTFGVRALLENLAARGLLGG
ncbi:MAG TPA: fumarylacetoacetate hydrolase family protein [Solirubrobacteraceae bacterium]|nr:fumarylacetoacetate hydrolase family protein [Solirubrobacteraceae bacterium]